MTYAQMVYEGQWFTPLREALDAFFNRIQSVITGSVTMRLYKGSMTVKSRKSPYSLYRKDMASFDSGNFNHQDAEGFINLLGLPAAVRSLLTSHAAADSSADRSANAYETVARTF
jgi:argininosuccinate synthase